MTKSTENEIEKTPEELEKEVIELERNEKGRVRLLNNLASGDLSRIKDRVAFILNTNPKARNSDAELAWGYWQAFEKEGFDGGDLSKEQFQQFQNYKSIHRSRATIQNKYGLFLANEAVRNFRKGIERRSRDLAIEEIQQPNNPILEVFIDESGKTNDNLTVGGLWVGNMSEKVTKYYDLKQWKKTNGINYEFHFSALSRHRLNQYKEFFSKFLVLNPTAGFKVIIVDKKGNKDFNKIFTHLTFHLLWKGIIEEDQLGRASLPRKLDVWIDEDETGSDRIKIENIKERLIAQKIEGLVVGNIDTVSSAKNYHIQIVDLFVSSVNRKLHHYGEKNHKDEFATFVLDKLNFNLEDYVSDGIVDNSTVFNLNRS